MRSYYEKSIKKYLLLGLALALSLVMFSCKQDKQNQNLTPATIKITLRGDGKVTLKDTNPLSYTKGVTWEVVKEDVVKKCSVTAGFVFENFYLNDENGEQLKEAHIFNEDTTVFIETVDSKWVKVKYSELDNYLEKTASASELNYIHVIELAKENMEGKLNIPPESSELGNVLKKHKGKKIALKFDKQIEGLKSMKFCFSADLNIISIENIPKGVETLEGCFMSCIALEEVKNIPISVKSLKSCFTGCTSLKKAPLIPEGVQDMSHCFSACTELEEAPILPKSLVNLEECFLTCSKLKKAPEIPENVTNMASTFMVCMLIEEMPKIPSNVTNMKFTFVACMGLKTTQAIPAKVTDMRNIFLDCAQITSLVLECPYNNEKAEDEGEEGYYFKDALKGCVGLQAGSVTVPTAHLENYKKGAQNMGIDQGCFVGK